MLDLRVSRNTARVAAGVLLLSLLSASALADADKRSPRERELAFKLQSLQQQKQKSDQEKAELDAKLKELAGKQDAMAQEQEKTAREAASAARGLAASRRENEQLSTKLTAAEARIAELSKQLETAAAQLKQKDGDRRKLETVSANQLETIGRQSKAIEACVDKNHKLEAYGVDLLKKFKDGGSSLGAIQTFDVAQEYRDKFDAERIDPPRVAR